MSIVIAGLAGIGAVTFAFGIALAITWLTVFGFCLLAIGVALHALTK